MGGFAGLRLKSYEDEEEYEKVKKAIHDQIVAESDLMIFDEKQFRFENEGDDELSNGDQEIDELIGFNQDSEASSDPSKKKKKGKLEEKDKVEILDEDDSNEIINDLVSPSGDQKLLRKSTMATVDTRGFGRKN